MKMTPGKQGVCSRCGPSHRILELAQHKTSQSTWATTPCEKLRWGNQEPIRPVSTSALRAVPSARIQYLAQHKRGFSAWEDHRRLDSGNCKVMLRPDASCTTNTPESCQAQLAQQRDGSCRKMEEEETSFRKTQRASSKTSQYENIVRLSTPKTRSSSQEAGPPHTPRTPQSDGICHIRPGVRIAVVSPRLLRLSSPKQNHPDFQYNRQSVASIVSAASRKVRVSQRLVQLSLPKVKDSNSCYELGRPGESIWTVSRAARRATASPRVEQLAQPKQLPKDYLPPRKPEWSRRSIRMDTEPTPSTDTGN